MDTTAQRWVMLEPHIRHVGPDDDRARPACAPSSSTAMRPVDGAGPSLCPWSAPGFACAAGRGPET